MTIRVLQNNFNRPSKQRWLWRPRNGKKRPHRCNKRWGPFARRSRQQKQRLHHQTGLPAWQTRACSANRSPSTAAQAGRAEVSSNEATRLLALHRCDRSWNGRRDRPTCNATLAQAEASCSTQLHYLLVTLCKETALTRVVKAGAQEGLESSSLTPRTDLVDAQRWSVARAPEFQLRRRDRGTNGAVPPRHRPLRESKRRELPKQHPYRCSHTHVAGRTVEAASSPQQRSIDHMENAEGRDRQRQTCTGCCQFNTTAHGPVSVWYPRTRCLPEGQPKVARKGQRQKQAQERHPENAMSHLRQDRTLEERLPVQRGESEPQRKGQRWQGQEPCWHTTTVRQGQERCEVLERRRSRTCRQGLSEEEAVESPM